MSKDIFSNKLYESFKKDINNDIKFTGKCDKINNLKDLNYLKDLYDNDYIYLVNASPIISGQLVENGLLGFQTTDRYSFHFHTNELVHPTRGYWDNYPCAIIIKFNDIKDNIFGTEWIDTVGPMNIDINGKEIYFILPDENLESFKAYDPSYDIETVSATLKLAHGNDKVFRYKFCKRDERKEETYILNYSDNISICKSLRDEINFVLNNIFKNANKNRVFKTTIELGGDNYPVYAFINLQTNIGCWLNEKELKNPYNNPNKYMITSSLEGDGNILESDLMITLLKFIYEYYTPDKQLLNNIIKFIDQISIIYTYNNTLLYYNNSIQFIIIKLINKLTSVKVIKNKIKLLFDTIVYYSYFLYEYYKTYDDKHTEYYKDNIEENVLFNDAMLAKDENIRYDRLDELTEKKYNYYLKILTDLLDGINDPINDIKQILFFPTNFIKSDHLDYIEFIKKNVPKLQSEFTRLSHELNLMAGGNRKYLIRKINKYLIKLKK